MTTLEMAKHHFLKVGGHCTGSEYHRTKSWGWLNKHKKRNLASSTQFFLFMSAHKLLGIVKQISYLDVSRTDWRNITCSRVCHPDIINVAVSSVLPASSKWSRNEIADITLQLRPEDRVRSVIIVYMQLGFPAAHACRMELASVLKDKTCSLRNVIHFY